MAAFAPVTTALLASFTLQALIVPRELPIRSWNISNMNCKKKNHIINKKINRTYRLLCIIAIPDLQVF